MLRAISRWTPGLLALFAVGPAAGLMTGGVRAADGGPEASALVSGNPAMGLAALVGTIVLAALVAIPTSRFVNYRIATWAGAFVVAWGAWRQASVDELIRVVRPDSPLLALAAEGLIAGVLGVVLAIALSMVARPEPAAGAGSATPEPAAPRGITTGPLEVVRGGASWAGVGIAAVVTAVVAGGVCALLVLEPLKGQAIFGAAIGTFAGAAAGCWASSFVGPSAREPACFLGVLLAAALGPVIAHLLLGEGVTAASFAGKLPGFAGPIGLDWVAGGLMGVPGGVAATAHMVKKHSA